MSETTNVPASGLFGPGIFATGIDLSALDEQTAWRLGVFFGEQILAAEQRGVAEGRRQAVKEIRTKAADVKSPAETIADAALIAQGDT